MYYLRSFCTFSWLRKTCINLKDVIYAILVLFCIMLFKMKCEVSNNILCFQCPLLTHFQKKKKEQSWKGNKTMYYSKTSDSFQNSEGPRFVEIEKTLRNPSSSCPEVSQINFWFIYKSFIMNMKLRVQTPDQMMRNCKSWDKSWQHFFRASVMKGNKNSKLTFILERKRRNRNQRTKNQERILYGKRCFL